VDHKAGEGGLEGQEHKLLPIAESCKTVGLEKEEIPWN
jgi:hypothetical protein